ncbi:hypothetical protein RV14_GL001704 [Enterococcus ratti]|uniref:Uncharacterized protein n=1 Tax=Enterococcus ratti TaxID=150033 RepID=A0A1L8WQQ6_9ENTE|nr:hypothetical protein RV14_GL001704 [Enterococcus ratti]
MGTRGTLAFVLWIIASKKSVIKLLVLRAIDPFIISFISGK